MPTHCPFAHHGQGLKELSRTLDPKAVAGKSQSSSITIEEPNRAHHLITLEQPRLCDVTAQ